jgi:hypothetical protein
MVDAVTALPPIDIRQVAEFWERFIARGIIDASTPLPAKGRLSIAFERFEVLHSE